MNTLATTRISMDRLVELLVVSQAGSITAAAEQLVLRRSTLSRRLSALEEAAGLRLLHRNSRSLRLTEAGELMVARARRIVHEAEDAWRAISQLRDVPSGPLRISTPPTELFQSLLVSFAVAHPQIRVLVEATSQHVDLMTENIDVALRFGTVTNEGLVARQVARMRCSLVASPAYLERHGVPESPEALHAHRCILRQSQSELPDAAWPLLDGSRIRVSPHFACTGMGVGLRAVLAGVGIALLPEPLTADYRKQGTLCSLLKDSVGTWLSGYVVYPERRHLLPAVRAFIDHVVAFQSHRGVPTRDLFPPLAGEKRPV